MSGFTGSSCDRLACPSSCHGRGVCLSLRDLADKERSAATSQRFTYGEIWDADKMQGCLCDFPSAGYDCSQTLCPHGDDPLTAGQVNEVQLIKCTANTGTFALFFDGHPSLSIPYSAKPPAVRAALLHIPNIKDVKVTYSMPLAQACQLQSNIISIEFTQLFGPQVPLVAQTDRVMSAAGGYIEINADGWTSWRDLAGHIVRSVKGTKEDDICSNRGACDANTGICHCYDSNGDVYGSSNGYGAVGSRGDCGFVLSASGEVATCPGAVPCSGHGVCDTDSHRCYCQWPYTSGDCSEISCPTGRTWFAYPVADEEDHLQYTTCSDMGLCDTNTGQCVCREGFYGEACDYMSCPAGSSGQGLCSGHGRCMDMSELALWSTLNGDSTAYTYGTEANNIHTWDGDRIHGCLCDKGYAGYDCSLRLCPAGDDPGTYDDHSEVQILRCSATGGNFTLSFRQATTAVLQYDITASDLQDALNALPSIMNASVYFLYDGRPPDSVLSFVPPDKQPIAGRPYWWTMLRDVDDHATQAPTRSPTRTPTFSSFAPPTPPNAFPTGQPTAQPSGEPTGQPSSAPSGEPTQQPSSKPSTQSAVTHSFCDSHATQLALIHFTHTHGNLPAIQVDNSYLQDVVNSNGELSSGTITVYTDGQSVFGLQSIAGTTETSLCNNRGLCDFSTGLCRCFDTWTSSDGARQGQAGSTGDCGYRNDRIYTSFDSMDK